MLFWQPNTPWRHLVNTCLRRIKLPKQCFGNPKHDVDALYRVVDTCRGSSSHGLGSTLTLHNMRTPCGQCHGSSSHSLGETLETSRTACRHRTDTGDGSSQHGSESTLATPDTTQTQLTLMRFLTNRHALGYGRMLWPNCMCDTISQ